MRAVFGFPLHVGAVRLGALNLYCDRAGSLDTEQHADALVMADVAAQTVLLLQANAPPGLVAAELEVGADFQLVVHQAAGMVSVQLGVTVGQALVRLRAYAFGNDRALADVARDVVARTLRFDAVHRRAGLRVTSGRVSRTIGEPMPRETLLARTLVELADSLVADFDVVELLTVLADRCVDVLDVGAAGIMLAAPDGELRVMASSSEAMRVLELFELQARQGPCLETLPHGNGCGEPEPRRSRRPLAALRGRSARSRLSLRPCPADAPAGHGHRRSEPVQCGAG